MGTFHEDLGALHGITVVVDTPGAKVYIGRCHEMTDDGVLLLDVDTHEDGADGRSKADYIRRAAKVGVWSKHKRLTVPRAEIVSVRRLGEFTG